MKSTSICLAILLVAVSSDLLALRASDSGESSAKRSNSVEIVVDDMKLPHEGNPKGVPESYDWARRPRVGMGADPGKFRTMVAWGQVYEDERGNPAANTRVQIRNIEAYFLSKKDGRWHLLQRSAVVEGRAYREDFVGDVNKPANIRPEPDGGISVTTGGGYNFHFWTPGRKAIDPGDIAGIFTTVQARLVPDDPRLPDDRDRARYLLSMGGDYWLDANSRWNDFKTNKDIGIGRFKFVRSEWRSFNMTTLSEGQIRKNPPPFD